MKQILFSLSLVTSDSPSLPRLSCDRAVIAMMNERTLGNSASRLHPSMVEQHTREWMARSMLFLSVLRKLRVPSVPWLDETKARVTSICGESLIPITASGRFILTE